MRIFLTMRYLQSFPTVVPLYEAGYPRVTHPSATQSPQMNQSTASCVNLRERCFVRLACVKHAASVHPEPGSNSHVKVCIAQKLAWLIILFDYCCFVRNELNRVLVSFLSNVLVRKIIFIIFQGCFTVQLSRFLQSVFVSKALSFRVKPIVFFASALLFLYRVSRYYLIR